MTASRQARRVHRSPTTFTRRSRRSSSRTFRRSPLPTGSQTCQTSLALPLTEDVGFRRRATVCCGVTLTKGSRGRWPRARCTRARAHPRTRDDMWAINEQVTWPPPEEKNFARAVDTVVTHHLATGAGGSGRRQSALTRHATPPPAREVTSAIGHRVCGASGSHISRKLPASGSPLAGRRLWSFSVRTRTTTRLRSVARLQAFGPTDDKVEIRSVRTTRETGILWLSDSR